MTAIQQEITTASDSRRAGPGQVRGEEEAPNRRLPRWISWRNAMVLAIQFGLLAVLLLWWETSVEPGTQGELFYSRPSAVWDEFTAYVTGADFVPDSVATIQETLLGFALGAVLGVPVGLLLGRYPLFRQITSPFLTALNALPRVALAPMFILWFGLGTETKVYLAASVVFFIVMIATESGIRTIDPDFMMMGRSIGSTERHIFVSVVLPASVPAIFSGLRLGAVYALLSAIFCEMLASNNGWGQKIALHAQSFQAGSVFAVLMVVLAFALTFNAIMATTEKRLLHWQN